MNLEQAIENIEEWVSYIETVTEPYYLGESVWNHLGEIDYLLRFAKAVRTVPTTHDSKAESDEWDRFFEDIQKVTNGS